MTIAELAGRKFGLGNALEYDNLRAALTWSLQEPDRQNVAARLGQHLARYWVQRGTAAEGQHWLEEVLALDLALPALTRADLLVALGLLMMFRDDNDRALVLFEQGAVLHQAAGDRQEWALDLNLQAQPLLSLGRIDAATALAEQSVAVQRGLGHHFGIAWAPFTLGYIDEVQGVYDQALARFGESLALFEAMGHTHGAANQRANAANVLVRQGNHVQARFQFAQSLHSALEIDDRRGVAECLQGLAVVLGAEGRLREAVRGLGAAERARQISGFRLDPSSRPVH